MAKNTENQEFMNNKEENGTKLYKEPAFLKAERALLKLCFDEEYFDYIVNSINQDELILPEHKEIFSIIKDAKKGNINNTKEGGLSLLLWNVEHFPITEDG